MDTLSQDLRFAVRTLLRRPAFTLLAVLTLALGIGANSAIFSVVNAVLLKPLPFRDAERLMVVWASSPEIARSVGLPDTLPASNADFYDWKAQSRTLEKMSLMRSERATLTGRGEPEILSEIRVSGDFFDLLGMRAQLGRTLQPADDGTAGPTVVVLSHALWKGRFGGDPSIVGQRVTLDSKPVTVVGVMPAGFTFPRGDEMPAGFGFAAVPDLWMPMAFTPEQRRQRESHTIVVTARLAPGISRAAANAEMVAIAGRLARQYPSNAVWSARVEPLADQIVSSIKPALLVLFGAVALVLLIACVNVANLLLAQAAARQKEVAVRTALGASRPRMIRQLLTEALLLALGGGAAGLLLAFWGLGALRQLIPEGMRVGEVGADGRVLAFTLATALAAGLLAGLMPALQMTRSDLAGTLRDGTRTGAVTSRGQRTLRSLVVVETALAVLLAVGAGLLVRSFSRLTAVDPGFRSGGVLTLQVTLDRNRYQGAQTAAFYRAVLDKVRALPGVAAAGAVTALPMSGTENINAFQVEGMPRPEPGKMPVADDREATPGYFEAMGIPLRQGRLFRDGDAADAPQVVIIDETLARTYWPGTDPLGKRLRMGDDRAQSPWLTVVGVVGNIRNSGLHVEARPQLYRPQAQQTDEVPFLAVRTGGDPARLAGPVRSAVHAIDPSLPVSNVMTLEALVDRSLARRRFNLVLLGLFAVLAVVLAAVGIYGVMSYSVAQRTREIGLRMALGAQRGTVLGLVVREAGVLALAGLAAGLVLSLVATRLMASLLYGVAATDPLTLAGVSLCLALVSLAAALVPGQRATRVDPMIALRAD